MMDVFSVLSILFGMFLMNAIHVAGYTGLAAFGLFFGGITVIVALVGVVRYFYRRQ
jgi:hypothetical protein